jgi:RNA-dependent RNA polymerase
VLTGIDLCRDLYDLINLSALPQLTPQKLFPPAEYPPAPKKTIQGREASISDVKEFICDYINSDILGLISVRHLRLADVRDLGVNDPDCLKLAALHSKAVDFQKSGTPVEIQELPYPSKIRPDWDAGEIEGRRGIKETVYLSERALGELYRDIKLEEDQLQTKGTHPSPRHGTNLNINIHVRPLDRAKFDPITYHLHKTLTHYIYVDNVPHEHFAEAVGLLEEYISELTCICNDYALTSRSILSEEEVVAGTILERTSQRRRRQDKISEMRTASTTLVENVRDVLRGSNSDELEDWASRSWAAYQIAKSSDEFGRKSFGLLALWNAFEAADAIAQRNRDLARQIRS